MSALSPSGSGLGPGAAHTHSERFREADEVIWGGAGPTAGFVMLVEKHKGTRPHRKHAVAITAHLFMRVKY